MRATMILAALTLLMLRPAAAQYLTHEPPMGALQEGERVLVDDGSCGPGKIKEVIGGNHVLAGGHKHVVRRRRCIPKR
jgi:preprotein translocase subunit YajC